MSTFRNAVAQLVNKEAYFLLNGNPVKATVIQVNDDLAVLKLSSPQNGVNQFAAHIDSLSWVV